MRRLISILTALALAASLGLVAVGHPSATAAPVPGAGDPVGGPGGLIGGKASPGGGKAVGRRAEHGPASRIDVSAPLRDLPSAPPGRQREHVDSPMPTPAGLVVADPVVQAPNPTGPAVAIASSFAGVGANGAAPSDANGAVGPSYYFDLVNSKFQIFTKSGASVLGPLTTNTLWTGFGGECETEDHGDGTVRYDALADRWVVGQFALGPSGKGPFFQCLAVSTTSDPTGRYYRYAFPFASFPDYPKLAVWPDGYYQTMNMFSSTGAFMGANTCAYERAKMLTGDLASVQCINATTAYGAILPGDLDGITPPPAGAPDMQIGLGTDNTHLASFRFAVDWSPGHAGTSLTESDLAVAPYQGACASGGTCVPQPGTTQQLDSLGDRVMYRYAYRNFGDHESWAVNYSVSVAGVSAPRWWEVRRTPPAVTGPLSIYQDSTFAPDTNHRWMGSIAMDASGDMALGYSESSATMKPSIVYTGRASGDPLNVMKSETMVLAGPGVQTVGLNRWGDYTAMNIDPSDGCTFWYTNQYLPADGTFNWATQIASFAFPTCQPRTDNDFSVASFPLSGFAAPGGSTTTTISTGRTAGTAMPISLSVLGLPAGVTATFSPTSVVAGPGANSTSTMTLSAAAGVAPGTYALTISATATGTSLTHSTPFTLSVPGATIANGGFETGDLTAWTTSVGTASVVTGGHGGTYSALVGTTTSPSFDSSIKQLFTLAQPSTLSFWYQVNCTDTIAWDWATATLSDLTSGTTTTILPKVCTRSGPWTQASTVLGADSVGHTFALTLTDHDDDNPADPTLTRFDDIVLTPAAQPDFSMSASPSTQTVVAGNATSYQPTVTALNGFTGQVALSVSGLPSGATATFSPPSISGAGTTTLSITTTPTTTTGTFALTITAVSGSLTHTVNVSLTVTQQPDFTLSASPSTQTVRRNSTATYTLSIAPSGGFNGIVTLGVSISPSGPTAVLTPPSLSAGSSLLTVKSGTKTGTFTLVVTATSGPTTHTSTVSLTVLK